MVQILLPPLHRWEITAQRGEVAGTRTHSWWGVQPRFEPKHLAPQSTGLAPLRDSHDIQGCKRLVKTTCSVLPPTTVCAHKHTRRKNNNGVFWVTDLWVMFTPFLSLLSKFSTWNMFNFRKRFIIVKWAAFDPLVPPPFPSRQPPLNAPTRSHPHPRALQSSLGPRVHPHSQGLSLTRSGKSSRAKKRIQHCPKYTHSGGNSSGRTKWPLSGVDG